MKTKIYLLVLLSLQIAAYSAEKPIEASKKAKIALQKLKEQSDNPKLSNESEWISYLSKTELARRQSIRELKSLGETGVTAVRQELKTAKGEYQQMLIIALAALGDKAAVSETAELMLKAEKHAVRVVAAAELRGLKNKELIESFKKALSDSFKRRDGSCVYPKIIYPVRVIASDALVDLGLSLEEVRKIGIWWD